MQPEWLQWSKKLMAIAQNGLTYNEDSFNQERYGKIRQIAAEIAASHTGDNPAEIVNLFAKEIGHATPKVDVRAAVFKDGCILLVRERSDGLWTLPGGWADIGDSPAEAAVREVREEAGYQCRAVKLIAICDRDHPRHGHTPYPFHAYKVFFLCELIGGQASHSAETDGVGFFAQDKLPALSIGRVSPGQINLAFEHYANPDLPPDFD